MATDQTQKVIIAGEDLLFLLHNHKIENTLNMRARTEMVLHNLINELRYKDRLLKMSTQRIAGLTKAKKAAVDAFFRRRTTLLQHGVDNTP